MIIKKRKHYVLILLSLLFIIIGLFGSGIVKAKLFAISRKINQIHRYDYPSTNHDWIKIGNTPVYGNKFTGTIFDPYVWRKDSVYLMCASERTTGTLILLSSKDGRHWEKVTTMLKPIKDTWESIVNRGCVIKVDSLWYLFYTGQNMDNSAIGLAVSKDGLKYKRFKKNPILIPSCEYENKSVMNPCVIFDKTRKVFRMWYSAGETYEPDVICYAESHSGGGMWKKKKENPIFVKDKNKKWEQYKIGGCQVLYDKGKYYMFYIGYQNLDVARICYSTSSDGIKWIRENNNLLIAPSKNGWDADAIYKPTVVNMKDSILMWYNGRKGTDEYIGLAVKYTKHKIQ